MPPELAALIHNEEVGPRQAKITVGQWWDVWLEGYGTNRPSTRSQARVNIGLIKAARGTTRVARRETFRREALDDQTRWRIRTEHLLLPADSPRSWATRWRTASPAFALRVVDVDFMRGVVRHAIQYPAEPLKSETSKDCNPCL